MDEHDRDPMIKDLLRGWSEVLVKHELKCMEPFWSENTSLFVFLEGSLYAKPMIWKPQLMTEECWRRKEFEEHYLGGRDFWVDWEWPVRRGEEIQGNIQVQPAAAAAAAGGNRLRDVYRVHQSLRSVSESLESLNHRGTAPPPPSPSLYVTVC